MRKTSKGKLFVLLLVTITVLSMTILQVGASRGAITIGDVSEVAVIGNTNSITFYHCENTPSWAVSQIERSMLGMSDDGYAMVTTHNLLCLIGHNWQFHSSTVTIHGAYATNPRCSQGTRFIDTCTRSNCGVSVVRSESWRRISCC